jgi:hypothetical protein
VLLRRLALLASQRLPVKVHNPPIVAGTYVKVTIFMIKPNRIHALVSGSIKNAGDKHRNHIVRAISFDVEFMDKLRRFASS